MHRFLFGNRDELVARCKRKVAQRHQRAATEQQLAHGVPMFLDQLTRTLAAESDDNEAASIAISGPSGGDSRALSEIGLSATAHGKALLDLGYTVDQVVHDYGDLCQAITDLAFERNAPFAVAEFRTLNEPLPGQRHCGCRHRVQLSARCPTGCTANGVREAAAGLSGSRTAQRARHRHARRSGARAGTMPIGRATGAVLKRSLSTLGLLIGRATAEVRAEGSDQRQLFPVAAFIADVEVAARLDAGTEGAVLEVRAVDPLLAVLANRELLHAAQANLLQNAFKFTRHNSLVTLNAYAFGDHVHIDVEDHCGGLPPGGVAKMFVPFKPNDDSRAVLGLGLSIARQSIEADQGTLTVRDVPGSGCVFTISLPRHPLH